MGKLQRKIDFKLDGVTLSSCRSYWHDKAFKILNSYPAKKIKKISIHCSNCGYQLLWVVDSWSRVLGPYGITPCPNCFPGSKVETLALCRDCGTKKVFTWDDPHPFCPIHETKCPVCQIPMEATVQSRYEVDMGNQAEYDFICHKCGYESV